jgi:hypothetical protein
LNFVTNVKLMDDEEDFIDTTFEDIFNKNTEEDI